MPRISDKTKKLMEELYADNLSVQEIVRIAEVSYSVAYGYTRLMQMLNPETGEPFESRSQYQDYLARQKLNPRTGKPFESRSQYEKYQRGEKQRRLRKQELSDLVK